MAVQALEVLHQPDRRPESLGALQRWLLAPLLVSIVVALLFFQALFPWALLAVGSCVVLGLLVHRCPLAGLYLWIVLYPVNSIHFSIHGFGFQSFEKNAIPIFLVEIVNVLLLAVLVVKELGQRQANWGQSVNRQQRSWRWLLYLVALFAVLTAWGVLASDNVLCSAYGGGDSSGTLLPSCS